MKKILLVSILFLVTACSSLDKSVKNKSSKVYTTQISNSVSITFDSEGNFNELIATASAPFPVDIPLAQNSAIIIATILARKNISEFLNTEIVSDSFVERISETLDATNNYEKKDTNKTANKLKENISSKSRSILKGTYVKDTAVIGNRVIVTVVSTKQVTNKIKEIKDAISL